MDRHQVTEVLNDALIGRRLLAHPFYRRWEAGGLAPGELAAYAEQYRHIERVLPTVLTALVARLPESEARDLVAGTLADELGVPEAHASLFEEFAEATGAVPDAPPDEATAALIDLHLAAATTDPVAALSMVAAYETQAAAIAVTKSSGLREHYGFSATGTRFWDVHAAMEAEHAGWSLDALASLAARPAEVRDPAAAAAGAWWAFLDERESAAVAA
ncbi:MAG: TenA family transcriptional regulator [Acidimicrobiales bacterium]